MIATVVMVIMIMLDALGRCDFLRATYAAMGFLIFLELLIEYVIFMVVWFFWR